MIDRGLSILTGGRFAQFVPTAGYRWELGKDLHLSPDRNQTSETPGWMLVEAEGSIEHHTTYPLDDVPSLFLEFASLPADDREAALSFANKYGTLGVGKDWFARSPHQPRELIQASAEPFLKWAIEHARLADVVLVWNHWRESNREELRTVFEWRQIDNTHPGGWYRRRELRLSQEVPRTRLDMSGWVRKQYPAKTDDIMSVADAWISWQVSDGLQAKDFGQDRLALELVSKPNGHTVELVPQRLIGALWLQLARAIAGRKTYTACRDCGKLIEVAPGGRNTKRREFCSDTCKVRSYRRRRDRAIELTKKWKMPERVAKQLAAEGLETELGTVKKWIAKANE